MRKKLHFSAYENLDGFTEIPCIENMPVEMFVPNQQQWLELRNNKISAYYLCDFVKFWDIYQQL